MSALGHKQTCAPQKAMSALPPIATAKADSGFLTFIQVLDGPERDGDRPLGMAGFELSFAAHATTPLMFGVGIGHNAKRRIEPQLFFQRLAEIITLAAQLVILRFQCRQLRRLLLLHLDVLIKLAAQLATLPLQARQLLGKLGEELEPRFIVLIHQENSGGCLATIG
jgi:hypothetical protein